MFRFCLIMAVFMCVQVQAKTFFNAPDVIYPGDENYQNIESRKFQGIPSLAVSPGGRIWVTWYAGPTAGEDKNNYVVLATSGDGGKNWQEILIIDPDGAGPVRAFDPEIWLDPQGKLWLFWAQHFAHDKMNPHAGVWAMVTNEPDSSGAKWSSPRRLTEGIMMCKPTVLSSGRWLLSASTWRETDYSARAVASDDGGRSLEVIGACNVPVDVRSFDEHMIVERKDGSLWMLVRTKYGIGESVSDDGGKTWPELEPCEISHPSARFFIRRLDSGNLLLVKHGPIDERTGRSRLMAFISKDDGKTWQGGLMIDEREGVSYPDGQQVNDGRIYITYDYSRTGDQDILMAVFTEEDVIAGKAVSGKTRFRVPVNSTADNSVE
ncbi:putative neuraminidase (sialidase) [Limihaloglobus sulfuriphilus]|uniref:Putative neuraminidase (Sialidase) n=1 Tax=Limihaloglobus sulfuriphilus TaxID=1851148 RepID=A0A1Q2MAV3_9BACT|nr:sialidase family protein [Limihaloglobus sulfuriphilus]AQQ69789.1 putative neuraminidase (sialidase) [Limihaloglobus sulfuriphilus]